jgi:hypothetical protein
MKRRERKEKRLCTFHCYYPVVKNEQRKKRKTRKNTERERNGASAATTAGRAKAAMCWPFGVVYGTPRLS